VFDQNPGWRAKPGRLRALGLKHHLAKLMEAGDRRVYVVLDRRREQEVLAAVLPRLFHHGARIEPELLRHV
jgi:hypothetical protein